jgi:hypothetical protein
MAHTEATDPERVGTGERDLEDVAMADEVLPLEERRALYAAWRTTMTERVERNRALIDLRDQADPQSEASDEWAPERLFVFASQADAHDG